MSRNLCDVHSGEFPALRNPTQQNKKAAAAKANSKPGKAGSSKSKKEEVSKQHTRLTI